MDRLRVRRVIVDISFGNAQTYACSCPPVKTVWETETETETHSVTSATIRARFLVGSRDSGQLEVSMFDKKDDERELASRSLLACPSLSLVC